MPLLIRMYNAVRLEVAKGLSPYPSLGIVPSDLNALLEKSTFAKHDNLRYLVENLNFNLPTRNICTINNHRIDDNAAQAIAGAVKNNQVITKVSFENCGLNLKNAQMIVEGLAGCKSLESLDLSRNELGDAGIVQVAEALQKQTSLKSLKLSFNQVGDAGAVALVKLIKSNVNLMKLELAELKLSEAAVVLLRAAAIDKPGFDLTITLPQAKAKRVFN